MDVPVWWITFLIFCLHFKANAEVTITETSLAYEALSPVSKLSGSGALTAETLASMIDLSDESISSSDDDVGCKNLGQNVRLNQQLTHVNSQLLNQLTQMVKKNAEVADTALQTVLSSTVIMAENSNLVRDLTLATQSNARAIADVIRATRKNTDAISVISKFLTDMKANEYHVENTDNNISRRSLKRAEEEQGDTYFTVSLTETLKEARDNFLQKILPKQTMKKPSPTPLVITDEDLMPLPTPATTPNISYPHPLPTSKTRVPDIRLRPVNPKVNIKTRSCVTGFLTSETGERFCSLRTGHTWASATAWCESQGLVLAQPKDLPAMSKRIQAQDSQSGRSWVYWIGGRGTGKTMAWLNGSNIASSDPVWRTGHPGYSTSVRDCLAIQTSGFSHHGLLRAYSCESDNIYVVCS